jgi:hypothetical protein
MGEPERARNEGGESIAVFEYICDLRYGLRVNSVTIASKYF